MALVKPEITPTKNIHLKEAASGFVNHNFHNLNTTGLGMMMMNWIVFLTLCKMIY